MAAGPYITTHQGLTDWYPTWIGAPTTSIGKLVTNVNEAVEEVRRQVKNGVDCIKIAIDGIQRRPDGELIAAFTQEETDIIVRESHRLGKKAVVARGRPRGDALCGARRRRPDLSRLRSRRRVHRRDAGQSAACLCPTLTHPRNMIDFTQPHDPAYLKGRVEATEQRYKNGIARLKKAVAAGVPFLTGTDLRVRHHPLRRMARQGIGAVRRRSRLHPGRGVAGGDRGQRPVHDPGAGGDRRPRSRDAPPILSSSTVRRSPISACCRIAGGCARVYIAGKELRLADRPYDPRQVTDFALSNWTDLYTRARVAELGIGERRLAAE